MKRRKIERIFIIESDNFAYIYAECNDGTLFQKFRDPKDNVEAWVQEPSIPQPKKEIWIKEYPIPQAGKEAH